MNIVEECQAAIRGERRITQPKKIRDADDYLMRVLECNEAMRTRLVRSEQSVFWYQSLTTVLAVVLFMAIIL